MRARRRRLARRRRKARERRTIVHGGAFVFEWSPRPFSSESIATAVERCAATSLRVAAGAAILRGDLVFIGADGRVRARSYETARARFVFADSVRSYARVMEVSTMHKAEMARARRARVAMLAIMLAALAVVLAAFVAHELGGDRWTWVAPVMLLAFVGNVLLVWGGVRMGRAADDAAVRVLPQSPETAALGVGDYVLLDGKRYVVVHSEHDGWCVAREAKR